MKRGGAALKNRVASLRLSCSESVDIITTMRIPERPIRPSYNLEFFWEKIQETQWSCSMNTPRFASADASIHRNQLRKLPECNHQGGLLGNDVSWIFPGKNLCNPALAGQSCSKNTPRFASADPSIHLNQLRKSPEYDHRGGLLGDDAIWIFPGKNLCNPALGGTELP